MELRSYWAIILRRFWIIVLIVGVVALYAAYQYYHLHKLPGALKTYQSTVTLRIGLAANARSTDQSYADYISASETLADEFVTGPVLTSQDFTTRVYQQIQTDMPKIHQRYPQADLSGLSAGSIGGALSATRAHSLVTVTVNENDAATAWAVATAVGEVSTADMSTFLDYEIRSTPTASTDAQHPAAAAQVVGAAADPALVPGPDANKPTLLAVLVVVALIIGIALAFLVDYLDDRIRSKDEVEQLLQLPSFGEVPRAPAPGKENESRSAVA